LICRHNYVYTQGYFYCTKCGHRRYSGSYRGRQRTKKIGTGIGLTVVIIVIGFFIYQNTDVITQNVTEQIELVKIPQYIENIPDQKDTKKDTIKVPATPKAKKPELTLIQIPKKPELLVPMQLLPIIKINGTWTGIETETMYDGNKLVTSELELQIHNLINNEREAKGLHPLAFDTELSTIASIHSVDMARRNFIAHDNPDGQDPTARGLEIGYTCHKELGDGYYTEGIAENLFQNYLYDSYTQYGNNTIYEWITPEEIAESTVDGWMQSPGHRENILTKTYDREGIGVAVSFDYKVYITENFC